jgi:hypothetical protein
MPFVLFKLDGKERKFRLDYNVLAMVKSILGPAWPGMKAFWRQVDDDPEFVRALYWAAFKTDDPTLTIEQVGKLLTVGNMQDLQKQVMDHFAYITQGAGEAEGNPPRETIPETVKSTGPSPSDEREKLV